MSIARQPFKFKHFVLFELKGLILPRGLAAQRPGAPNSAAPACQHPGGAPGAAEPKAAKPKKSNPYHNAKLVSAKLQTVSSKLTDSICWDNKLDEHKELFLGLTVYSCDQPFAATFTH